MNRMRGWKVAAAAALLAPCSLVAGGLEEARDGALDDWPRWQGRLSLGHAGPMLRLGPTAPDAAHPAPELSLMGDYYLTRSGWGFTERGGFRATSGLVLGHGARTLLSLGAAPGGHGLSVQQRRLGSLGMSSVRDASREADTAAYLGLGYTGYSRGGWGFSADVGVLSHGAGTARLGRDGGGERLDEALRELRLAPLVQLGVSYAF